MFRILQEKLHTPDKFYDTFLSSDIGKKAFDTAYQLFYIAKDTLSFVNHIINSMQDWLFDQLTDDEMNSAYSWFQTIETDLKKLIFTSIH